MQSNRDLEGANEEKPRERVVPASYHVVLVMTKKDKYYHKTMAE